MNTYIKEIESFFKTFIDNWMLKLEFRKCTKSDGTIKKHWLSIQIQTLNSYTPSVDWYSYNIIWWLYVDDDNINECIQHIIMCITNKCINVIQDLNWITKEYDLVKKNII